MALVSTEKTLCNKLLADWKGLLAPVYAAKSAFVKAKNDMVNKLKEMVQFDLFTGEAELNDRIQEFKDQIKDNLPGDELDDLQRIKNFLDNCPYLKPLGPVSALIGTVLGIFDEIDNAIDHFFNALNIPEFGAANLGSVIDNLLNGIPGLPGGDALADLLARADELLQCLDALCAVQDPYYQDRLDIMIDELQELYDSMNINGEPGPNYGKFDYDNVYSEAGLSGDQQSAIDNTKAGLNDSKNAGMAAIDNTKSAIQAATKLGGLF